jgi:hypothetical protein
MLRWRGWRDTGAGLRIFRIPETKRPGMGRDESLFRMFLPALGTAGRKVGDAYFYL